MKSVVIDETVVITGEDILYVAQQIKRDLKALSKAYPHIISLDYADDIHDSFTTFLANNAVSRLGFGIYDFAKDNLVYHEYRYKVLRGGEITDQTGGGKEGKGGQPVEKLVLPPTAIFTAWVNWSSDMRNMPEEQQKNIVENTGWLTPSQKNGGFNQKYEGGEWTNSGLYASGQLGVDVDIWKKNK
jgi:hypothetical protein